MRKPAFGVSDQVRHKPGCAITEYGKRLEILDLDRRGIVLCSKNKGADQLPSYREADLRLCFRIFKKPVFSRRSSFHDLQVYVTKAKQFLTIHHIFVYTQWVATSFHYADSEV